MNLLLFVNILILIALTYIIVGAIIIYRQTVSFIDDFVAGDAEHPSPLSKVMDIMADKLAKQIAAEVRTTIGGIVSGQVRSQSALDEASTSIDLALDNPGLAGLVQLLPKNIRRMMMRNPAVMRMVMDRLSAHAPVAAAAEPNGADKVKFNF